MIIRPLHLARRFFSSLFPRVLSVEERGWVDSFLNDREAALFANMSRSDQAHSYRVAWRTEAGLAQLSAPVDPPGAVMAAALLHDVGKTEARLGTYGRVVATLSLALAGADMAPIWRERSGFTRKVGLYGMYGEIGRDMLALADSHPWVVAWSGEHHLDVGQWTVPRDFGEILAEADE